MKPKHREQDIYPAVASGRLRIDPQGRIWRGQKRAENITNVGYMQIRATVAGVRHHAMAHRLVWFHFNGPIPGVLQVNHRNGIKTDNRPENLELVTPAENVEHTVKVLDRHGSLRQSGEQNRAAKLTAAQVAEIRQRRAQGEMLTEIAADYGVAFQTVSKICRGDRWASPTG